MMLVVLVALVFLCLWRIQLTKANPDYITLDGTNAIKGVFAIIILCSHLGGYLTLADSFADRTYTHTMFYLGQTMVAPYLFYSGFGVFFSYRHKPGYASGFFKKRFLKILLHFDLAILLFLLVQAFLPIHYPARNYLLCWIGWESIGNSNWFVFVILSLYLIAFCGLLLERRKGLTLFAIVCLFSALLWLILHFVAHKESWWIDTIAAFPLGMLFGASKDSIDTWLAKYQRLWFVIMACVSAIFIIWHHLHGVDIYGICSCLFCLIVILASMKIKIGNPALNWLGKNAFSIYILQRLPMLVLSHFGINLQPGIFIPVSIVVSLLLAWGFTSLTTWIDQKVFNV
jgi:hypothetical protein